MTSRPLAAIARPLIIFLCFYLGFIAPYNGGASAPSSPAAVTTVSSDDPKYIALTFDDGPGGEYTDMILDHLEACGARGTFFIMGCRINDNLPQIKRMIEGGHQLGNHTWDHVDLTKTDKDATLRQIILSELDFDYELQALVNSFFSGQRSSVEVGQELTASSMKMRAAPDSPSYTGRSTPWTGICSMPTPSFVTYSKMPGTVT